MTLNNNELKEKIVSVVDSFTSKHIDKPEYDNIPVHQFGHLVKELCTLYTEMVEGEKTVMCPLNPQNHEWEWDDGERCKYCKVERNPL